MTHVHSTVGICKTSHLRAQHIWLCTAANARQWLKTTATGLCIYFPLYRDSTVYPFLKKYKAACPISPALASTFQSSTALRSHVEQSRST